MPFADSRGEHTNDLEYRANRPKALQRDTFQCQIKGPGCTGAAEEVDHKVNFKAGGSHALPNLQSVCKPCHKRKTQRESFLAWQQRRRDAKHPDSLRKHPGLK